MSIIRELSCLFLPCFIGLENSERGIVQQFGKYKYTATPGLNFISWPFQSLTPVSVKVHILDCTTSTKTKDNVRVEITTAVQFSVDPKRVEDFFFKLDNPDRQIEAHVDNLVRSHFPKLDLDAAFAAKDELASTLKDSLSRSLEPYGIIVHSCLMTDMQPDANVMAAMNEINAARRLRQASAERAEAEKVVMVKRAEAEAEAKHLSGVGTARMRQAITDGFKISIESMKASCGLDAREVVHMMLATHYLDVLKDFALSGKSSIVVPHGPSAIGDIAAQVRNGFLQAAQVGMPNSDPDVPKPAPSAGHKGKTS